METGNHHNSLLFHKKKNPIRKPSDPSPPAAVFENCIPQRARRNRIDGIGHRFSKPQPEFRAYVFIAKERFFKFRVRFRQPDDRKRHYF